MAITLTSKRVQVGNAAFAIAIEQSGADFWVGWTVTRGRAVLSDTPVKFDRTDKACFWYATIKERLETALSQFSDIVGDNDFTANVFKYVYSQEA